MWIVLKASHQEWNSWSYSVHRGERAKKRGPETAKWESVFLEREKNFNWNRCGLKCWRSVAIKLAAGLDRVRIVDRSIIRCWNEYNWGASGQVESVGRLASINHSEKQATVIVFRAGRKRWRANSAGLCFVGNRQTIPKLWCSCTIHDNHWN